MRTEARQQAHEATQRLMHAAIAGAGARVASAGAGRTHSLPAMPRRSPIAGRATSAASSVVSSAESRPGSSGNWSGVHGRHRASPSSPLPESAAWLGEESMRTQAGRVSRRLELERSSSSPQLSRRPETGADGDSEVDHARMPSPTQQPDQLEYWVLREELRQVTSALARAQAIPEVVDTLDMPGLAALRSELIAAHNEALERIDDRRVALQAKQAAAREGPERGRCVVCWSRSADRVVLPCRHLCLCGNCLRACHVSCPICRGPVTDALEIFGVS